MKLSRLTNRQLRNLLRWGEVRFALNPKSPLRQKLLAEGMGRSKAEYREQLKFFASRNFLRKFRDFCKDTIDYLKRGKFEFEDVQEAMRFVKKFDEVARKVWFRRPDDFTISGAFPSHKPTPNNIAVVINENTRKHGYLHMTSEDVFYEAPKNPNFYSMVKSFAIPDAWSYFREFRK